MLHILEYFVCIPLATIDISLAAFYIGYTLISFFSRKSSMEKTYCDGKEHSFLIIVPAHNEENMISITLKSVLDADYPQDKIHILVIADNCTDRTVDVASRFPVQILRRNNLKDIGKGYAIEYALQHVDYRKYDAIIILDADCTIDRDFFRAANSKLNSGAKVIQVRYDLTNYDDTFISYLMGFGNFLENEFFYKPKSFLGFSVFLRGTGMIFSSEIIANFPWYAYGLVEDMEYSLLIIRNRIKIHFIPYVAVYSKPPSNQDQLKIQRTRWVQGNIALAKKNFFYLMLEGIRSKNILLVESALSLLLQNRIFTFFFVMLSLIVVSMVRLIYPLSLYSVFVYTAFALLILYVISVFLYGINRKRLKFLLHLPRIMIKMLFINLKGIFGTSNISWHKTPR
jgi:cellulose synthase/poly-beta-1,6-N-acetylglucosamine synthase-like glycosyltransferase